jgi:hypothetical protein
MHQAKGADDHALGFAIEILHLRPGVDHIPRGHLAHGVVPGKGHGVLHQLQIHQAIALCLHTTGDVLSMPKGYLLRLVLSLTKGSADSVVIGPAFGITARAGLGLAWSRLCLRVTRFRLPPSHPRGEDFI